MSEMWEDLAPALWFVGVILAVIVLFAYGIRFRTPQAGLSRWLSRAAVMAGAAAVAIVANIALYRHDTHLDMTREAAFTPSSEAQDVVRRLRQPVELAYFYKKQDPASGPIITTLGLLARLNPLFRLELVDTDQNPGRANQLGVRIYNTAIIKTAARRIEVLTTDDREIALAIMRAVRDREIVICFATGHGEYDIDNYEFHTHFEGGASHSHNTEGLPLVQMEQHGVGRLRRALDKLGLSPKKAMVAAGDAVPSECAALVEANPRTRFAPPETETLRAYLERGGSLLLLIEPDYPVDESLAALLLEAGVRVENGFIVDPNGHYFTDEQMLAVSNYARHPITQGLALSIYPGARPIAAAASEKVKATVLFSSTASSYLLAERGSAKEALADAPRGPQPMAVASEGRLSPDTQASPFRLVVFGDADFASNSFFPYLSNADMVLGSLSWLTHEEKAPNAKPVVEVLPRVVLTGAQVKWIFILTVLLLPGAMTLLGGFVWWRRH